MDSEFKISWAAARVNANLTQRQVCEKLHLNIGTLGNWENGSTSPTFEMCFKLSELYGVPLQYIKNPN